MTDPHDRTTPMGHKITTVLEEAGLPYRVLPVIPAGDQLGAEFLAASPNSRVPAIVR